MLESNTPIMGWKNEDAVTLSGFRFPTYIGLRYGIGLLRLEYMQNRLGIFLAKRTSKSLRSQGRNKGEG